MVADCFLICPPYSNTGRLTSLRQQATRKNTAWKLLIDCDGIEHGVILQSALGNAASEHNEIACKTSVTQLLMHRSALHRSAIRPTHSKARWHDRFISPSVSRGVLNALGFVERASLANGQALSLKMPRNRFFDFFFLRVDPQFHSLFTYESS